jgi:SAM-dependent methyltransferase
MSPEGEVHAAVRSFGPLPDAHTLAKRTAEPLLESAPLAFTTAMAHCPHDSACQVYHAVWQYLRLAEVVRSVRVDGPIYAAVAEQLACAGRLRRVLITATADYSMLAHLAYGVRRAGADVEFSIIDRCATALQLNAWYADRNGLDVRTIQADVLEHEGGGDYDLICTHSLLTLLPPVSRGRLFSQWRRSLARSGRICFSNRVWNHHIHLTQREIDRRSAAMAEGAIRKLEQNGVPLPCPADHFAKLVTRYSERYGNRSTDLPPLPLSDIERWAQDADLDIEIAVPAGEVVADASDQAPGPFPTDRGPRMWFQLRQA